MSCFHFSHQRNTDSFLQCHWIGHLYWLQTAIASKCQVMDPCIGLGILSTNGTLKKEIKIKKNERNVELSKLTLFVRFVP